MVSNYGGRQLDGALSSLEALTAIAPVAHGKLPLLLDCGIRRGANVAKAPCLRAGAVLLGCATLYGVAVAGQASAARALSLLKEEVERCMNLIVCR
ncbi:MULTISPECIES: alpha-hydroxy-acid oxidizing protein [unclassified Pseudomonas]|uniref:alpha-hydroxy-acid oxidizing protein n=1 Tax=unclassified Pseudomonas TaxID=196821 RepID=UPI001E35C32D|nr:alpha-hydroxy-acid oxidizing protein [Pseudomonas sp. Snoq117.2]MCD4867112.1 alpha-hydroxy-acid oxidizing protein [Pseudomonas sp. PLB05]